MKYIEAEVSVVGFAVFAAGIVVGAIISLILSWVAATNSIGFGLECANKVLNDPKVSIDTTYTIHQQDTTVTYHFIKDR